MVTASLRKSITDLSRRRARTAFTAATLALAVASIGFLAIPTLIDRSMQEEVRATRLADVTVSMRPLALTPAQLDALAELPNVAAVEPWNTADTRVLVGERRAPAVLIGVPDFTRQQVDVVRVDSGAPPGAGDVLVEVQNANVGVFDARAGQNVTVLGPRGARTTAQLRISGEGRNIPGGERVQDEDVIVLYAKSDTVAELSGERGYNRLAFRLRDTSPGAAATTIEAVRLFLGNVRGFAGFDDLPSVRAPGDWPGKEETEAFADFLTVITVLALLSALVLISNTMTTLVAEQTGEIGIMRAIGARRRQVALVYLRTALLLGSLGGVVGVTLGILLANLLAGYFGSMFWAIDVGFGVDLTIVVASILVALVAPPLAALPAIRRGVRTDLRQALQSTGSAVGSEDVADRALRRARFLPRSMQIGLRNVGRRKRRSFATALIVALAVGNLLAVLGIAAAATESSRTSWASHLEDVQIWTGGRALFDERAGRVIRSTPGVAEAEPVLKNTVELAGEEAVVWGVEREPLFDYRLAGGRWFTAGETQRRDPVAVIERNIAQIAGVGLGDRIALATAAGKTHVRIVGLAKNQQEEGTALYVPLTTVRALLDRPTGAGTYWIKMTSSDPAFVDRTTTLLEDRLTALGYEIGAEIAYIAERDEIAESRSLTTTIGVLGFVIVAMSMVGLANAITMSVLERTREVGILRCIGARARDVRRIFTTEGIALAAAGWLLGIPLGYLLTRLLVRLLWEVAAVRIPVVFPPWNVVIALVGTIVLGLLVTLLPVRRAVRMRPGDAIRYA